MSTINNNSKIIEETTWFYKASESTFASQEDWNQTLITQINQAGAILNRHITDLAYKPTDKETFQGANLNYAKITSKVIVPLKFKDIITSLMYYQESVLGNRFDVFFIDKDIDYITVLYGIKGGIDFGVNINIIK